MKHKYQLYNPRIHGTMTADDIQAHNKQVWADAIPENRKDAFDNFMYSLLFSQGRTTDALQFKVGHDRYQLWKKEDDVRWSKTIVRLDTERKAERIEKRMLSLLEDEFRKYGVKANLLTCFMIS